MSQIDKWTQRTSITKVTFRELMLPTSIFIHIHIRTLKFFFNRIKDGIKSTIKVLETEFHTALAVIQVAVSSTDGFEPCGSKSKNQQEFLTHRATLADYKIRLKFLRKTHNHLCQGWKIITDGIFVFFLPR